MIEFVESFVREAYIQGWDEGRRCSALARITRAEYSPDESWDESEIKAALDVAVRELKRKATTR